MPTLTSLEELAGERGSAADELFACSGEVGYLEIQVSAIDARSLLNLHEGKARVASGPYRQTG